MDKNKHMSIPFQTYFETDLHCFWKNNVKTLRFQNFAYINDAIYNGR